MNLYLVVSENIGCNSEEYLVELVVARNNSQACYLTWKSDKWDDDDYHDISVMPKFRTECKVKGVDGPARIVSEEYCDGNCECNTCMFNFTRGANEDRWR